MGADIEGESKADSSGKAVSISSDGLTLAIGAHLNDENGLSSGHVRVYPYDGSQWIQMGNDIDGENVLDYSGRSLSLSSDGLTLAIGAEE